MVAPLAGWLTVRSMTDKMEWQGQVGSSWAREWQRTDRSFAPLTQQLIERIVGAGDAERIADIGCGAGELSIKLADALPAADILGLDISSDLIAAAIRKGFRPFQSEFRGCRRCHLARPAFCARSSRLAPWRHVFR